MSGVSSKPKVPLASRSAHLPLTVLTRLEGRCCPEAIMWQGDRSWADNDSGQKNTANIWHQGFSHVQCIQYVRTVPTQTSNGLFHWFNSVQWFWKSVASLCVFVRSMSSSVLLGNTDIFTLAVGNHKNRHIFWYFSWNSIGKLGHNFFLAYPINGGPYKSRSSSHRCYSHTM